MNSTISDERSHPDNISENDLLKMMNCIASLFEESLVNKSKAT